MLISPPAESTELSFWLFCWHSPMERACLLLLLPVRKSSQHGGCRPFPGKLRLPVQTDAKPTPFSLSSNSNTMLQSCLVPCCAVVASPFLQNCSQGGTEELHSKSQLCLGAQRLPPACRSGSARFRLGSQLPWLLARFNQAGMKACSATCNRLGFDR